MFKPHGIILEEARTELAQVSRELKQLRAQLATLEERRAALLAELTGKAIIKRDRPS